MEVVEQEYAQVPVDSLTPHPENTNVGDLETIRSSVRRNKFYGAVIVQKSTNHIIAGEHRWRVAVDEGAETVPAIVIDVDDEEAKRIMTVDNRSARLGYDDEERLLAVLRSFDGDLVGTGYDDAAFQQLLMSTGALGDQEAAFLASLSEGESTGLGGTGDGGIIGEGHTELRLPMTTDERAEAVRFLRMHQAVLQAETLTATLLEVLRTWQRAEDA